MAGAAQFRPCFGASPWPMRNAALPKLHSRCTGEVMLSHFAAPFMRRVGLRSGSALEIITHPPPISPTPPPFLPAPAFPYPLISASFGIV